MDRYSLPFSTSPSVFTSKNIFASSKLVRHCSSLIDLGTEPPTKGENSRSSLVDLWAQLISKNNEMQSRKLKISLGQFGNMVTITLFFHKNTLNHALLTVTARAALWTLNKQCLFIGKRIYCSLVCEHIDSANSNCFQIFFLTPKYMCHNLNEHLSTI